MSNQPSSPDLTATNATESKGLGSSEGVEMTNDETTATIDVAEQPADETSAEKLSAVADSSDSVVSEVGQPDYAHSASSELKAPSLEGYETLEPPEVHSEPAPEIESKEMNLSDLEASELEALDQSELELRPESEPPVVDPETTSLPAVRATSIAPKPPSRSLTPAVSVESNTVITEQRPPPPKRSIKPKLPEQPRRKPWWETLFGDDFSRAYRSPTNAQMATEADFIEANWSTEPGGVVLDLACGQGELSIELTKRGYSVVGYDLSVFQLAVAGENAQAAEQKINFLQGDMREMAFVSMFDAICCWGSSFGYFEDEKNFDLAQRMFAALKPGGTLLLDVMNRDFVAADSPRNIWFEGDGCVCMDDAQLDWITNRLKVKRSLILDDGRSKELNYAFRVYSLSEIGKILHDAGFLVTSVSGEVSTQGAFFGPNSSRIIIAAQKPA